MNVILEILILMDKLNINDIMKMLNFLKFIDFAEGIINVYLI